MFQRSTESHRLRQKQLDMLKEYNPTITSAGVDKWDLAAQLPDNLWLVFRIEIHARFPEMPPSIQLLRHNNQQATGISHPWLSPQMAVVGHPYTARWSAHHSLGKMVKEIVNEFAKNPPKFTYQYGQQAQAQPSAQPPGQQFGYGNIPQGQGQGQGQYDSGGSYNSGNAASAQPSNPYQSYFNQPDPSQAAAAQQQQQRPPERAVQVNIPSAFPELAQLDTRALQNMLKDEEGFLAWCTTLEVAQQLDKVLTEAKTANVEQAKLNLAKEEPLNTLQEEIATLRDLLKVKKSMFDEKVIRQQNIVNGHTPSAMFFRLAEKVTEADDQSEDIASAFMRSGDGNLQDFVKEFMNGRVLYHTRQAKKDRFSKHYNLR